MIRVAIAAAAPALRVGLRAMIESPSLSVVADGVSLASLDHELENVDVLLAAGEEALEDLSARDGLMAGMAVVIVADASDTGPLARLGLRGWALLSTDASADQIAAALAAASAGLSAVPAASGGRFSRDSAVPAAQAAALQPLEEPLTAREQEVLQLLAEGLSNKLIARRLGISEHTVKFHVSSTYGKLGASSRTEAVSHAARRGLIAL